MNNRVVVTGMGAVTPIGNDVVEFWNNAKEGIIGIEKISEDRKIENDKVKVVAPLKNFDVSKILFYSALKNENRNELLNFIFSDI